MELGGAIEIGHIQFIYFLGILVKSLDTLTRRDCEEEGSCRLSVVFGDCIAVVDMLSSGWHEIFAVLNVAASVVAGASNPSSGNTCFTFDRLFPSVSLFLVTYHTISALTSA